jgi:Bacterial regulatory proteins, luxR family
MSSKEIAQVTGLAPVTVDTYLKQAMSLLGASNRREAARLFSSLETSQKLGSPPPAVAPAPKSNAETATSAAGEGRPLFSVPPLGGTVNNLSASQTTLGIIQVVVLGVTVALGIVLLIAGVLKVVR